MDRPPPTHAGTVSGMDRSARSSHSLLTTWASLLKVSPTEVLPTVPSDPNSTVAALEAIDAASPPVIHATSASEAPLPAVHLPYSFAQGGLFTDVRLRMHDEPTVEAHALILSLSSSVLATRLLQQRCAGVGAAWGATSTAAVGAPTPFHRAEDGADDLFTGGHRLPLLDVSRDVPPSLAKAGCLPMVLRWMYEGHLELVGKGTDGTVESTTGGGAFTSQEPSSQVTAPPMESPTPPAVEPPPAPVPQAAAAAPTTKKRGTSKKRASDAAVSRAKDSTAIAASQRRPGKDVAGMLHDATHGGAPVYPALTPMPMMLTAERPIPPPPVMTPGGTAVQQDPAAAVAAAEGSVAAGSEVGAMELISLLHLGSVWRFRGAAQDVLLKVAEALQERLNDDVDACSTILTQVENAGFSYRSHGGGDVTATAPAAAAAAAAAVTSSHNIIESSVVLPAVDRAATSNTGAASSGASAAICPGFLLKSAVDQAQNRLQQLLLEVLMTVDVADIDDVLSFLVAERTMITSSADAVAAAGPPAPRTGEGHREEENEPAEAARYKSTTTTTTTTTRVKQEVHEPSYVSQPADPKAVAGGGGGGSGAVMPTIRTTMGMLLLKLLRRVPLDEWMDALDAYTGVEATAGGAAVQQESHGGMESMPPFLVVGATPTSGGLGQLQKQVRQASVLGKFGLCILISSMEDLAMTSCPPLSTSSSTSNSHPFVSGSASSTDLPVPNRASGTTATTNVAMMLTAARHRRLLPIIGKLSGLPTATADTAALTAIPSDAALWLLERCTADPQLAEVALKPALLAAASNPLCSALYIQRLLSVIPTAGGASSAFPPGGSVNRQRRSRGREEDNKEESAPLFASGNSCSDVPPCEGGASSRKRPRETAESNVRHVGRLGGPTTTTENDAMVEETMESVVVPPTGFSSHAHAVMGGGGALRSGGGAGGTTMDDNAIASAVATTTASVRGKLGEEISAVSTKLDQYQRRVEADVATMAALTDTLRSLDGAWKAEQQRMDQQVLGLRESLTACQTSLWTTLREVYRTRDAVETTWMPIVQGALEEGLVELKQHLKRQFAAIDRAFGDLGGGGGMVAPLHPAAAGFGSATEGASARSSGHGPHAPPSRVSVSDAVGVVRPQLLADTDSGRTTSSTI